ncbi:hypothetical protein E2320_017319, partial [Naja naja]
MDLVKKRRRRIDRSMIGEPTNFVHTAHVGSGDLFSGMNSVSSIQNQMQSKGGYGGGMNANVQMQLVWDLQAQQTFHTVRNQEYMSMDDAKVGGKNAVVPDYANLSREKWT